MSWHSDQLRYSLGIGGLVSFYGVVSLIVYFVGDRFGYGYTERIVIIALVLLTLPFVLVIGYLLSRRRRKKEEKAQEQVALSADQSESAPSPPQKLAKPSGNYNELSTATEEVVQFLKNSNLGAGKDAVYSLPWYLVAGTPKSGKTSLVLSSGLNFQNLPSQRQSEQKFIRPTRNVDWRVTSDAVFLDTAGRYQTEGVDQEEWASLLETIKKYRGQRPLDGMILAVSAERILNADEAEIEQMAKVLRSRLDEVFTRTKTRFPVYLVFTHADAIEGFRDSFSASQREGETLVWGATIPLEKTQNAHALFDSEYDLLQTSVMKRRLIRLSAPFASVRQLKIFNFPLHFGSARRKLGGFVSTLFRPNPFSESPFLRGFYFTAVPVNRPQSRGGQTQSQVGQTIGQTYFTEKFFRDVVLRDKDLVATFQAQKVKPPVMGWLLTLFGTFLTIALLGLSAYSLYQNKQMLEEATRRGDSVLTIIKADAGRNPLDKKAEEARVEIDATEDLRKSLIELDNNERNGAPYSMRLGLYSGNRIYHEKLLPIYFNAVEQRFKKPMVKRLEDDLRKFSASQAVANPAQLTSQEEENLGKNYDLLKAYLMLSGDFKDKSETAFLSSTLSDYWKSESKVPSGSELVAQQQLDFFARQVDREEFTRIKLDNNVVDAARKKLQSFPAVFRYYKRKVTEISKEVDSKVGAKNAETILSNNGGDTTFVEGTYQVPGAYTIEGYRLMKKAISEADKELSADDWVMGEQDKKEVAQTTDASKLEERYFRDYADHWRAFVKGINVKSYTKQDAAKALQAFSSANSPMEILLLEISKNTNLSAKPKTEGWWDWIKSFFVSQEATDTGGNTQVEKEFRPLFGFVGEEGKSESAPIGKYRNEIGKVSNKLSGRSPDELNQIAQKLAADKGDDLRIRDAENAVTNLLGSFNETPSGQEIAELLREPTGNLRSLLGADAQSQIGKVWTDTVLPKAKEAEKGYPFEDSPTEADLTKLTAYLNPVNGTLSKFYTERLEKYFEDSGGQLKVKDTSDVKFNPEFVAYLNNAFRLREALFGKSATPSFGYEFKLTKVKDALIEVTIDGQKIDSNGTGSTTFKFPASAGDTGALMNFASTAETSTTSGNPPPTGNTSGNTSANSNTSNVNTSSNTNTVFRFLQNTNSSQTDSTSLRFPGTWGLFRFFEAGQPKKQPSGEYLLTYRLGAKIVTATIRPTGGDLFDRKIFTSARAPQNLLR